MSLTYLASSSKWSFGIPIPELLSPDLVPGIEIWRPKPPAEIDLSYKHTYIRKRAARHNSQQKRREIKDRTKTFISTNL